MTWQYETDTASTPDEIDRLLGTGHDIVMLDLSLGETDGMRVMPCPTLLIHTSMWRKRAIAASTTRSTSAKSPSGSASK